MPLAAQSAGAATYGGGHNYGTSGTDRGRAPEGPAHFSAHPGYGLLGQSTYKRFQKIQRGWVDIHECSAMPSERVGG